MGAAGPAPVFVCGARGRAAKGFDLVPAVAIACRGVRRASGVEEQVDVPDED